MRRPSRLVAHVGWDKRMERAEQGEQRDLITRMEIQKEEKTLNEIAGNILEQVQYMAMCSASRVSHCQVIAGGLQKRSGNGQGNANEAGRAKRELHILQQTAIAKVGKMTQKYLLEG